jgi:hypothetical protein
MAKGRRLVLLSMTTDDAEQFAKEWAEGDTAIDYAPLSKAQIEWVIAEPTVACECSQVAEYTGRRRRKNNGSRKSSDGFTKTQHFGWWVHANCGRVTRLVKEHYVSGLTNGAYDLLPEILDMPDATPNDLRSWPAGDIVAENARTKR